MEFKYLVIAFYIRINLYIYIKIYKLRPLEFGHSLKSDTKLNH